LEEWNSGMIGILGFLILKPLIQTQKRCACDHYSIILCGWHK